MRKPILPILCIAPMSALTGCIDLGDASQLLPVGTPFVVRGTMTLVDRGGACLVWQGDNGVSYYLYQDALLDNSTFDQITAPGVTSRLVLVTRSDLPAPCSVERIAQVQEVLEIVR